MSKRVLGNDPFQRTSVPRVERPKEGRPAARPKASAPGEPLVIHLDQAPTSHPASPTGVAVKAGASLPHAQSPTLLTFVDGVTPHPASPRLVEAREVPQTWAATFRRLFQQKESETVDAWGRDEEWVRALRPLADILFRHYFRVKVENADSLPAGPLIVVANHSGALPYDGPVLHHALTEARPDLKVSRWLLEDALLDVPYMGTLLNRLGGVRSTPENVLALLKEHRPVLVFPEGMHGLSKPFSERYRMQQFGRGGFLKLAVRASATVVPAAIFGAEESTPLLGKLPGAALGLPYLPLTPLGPFPLPSRWTIRFGAPVALPREADAETFRALNEKVRATLQDMLNELRK